MKWLVKALCFKVLSGIPAGARLYRYAQSHWTKSIVPTHERIQQKVNIGIRYLEWILHSGYGIDHIRNFRHLDFGAGWHPTIPLLYSALGMKDQILFDVSPLLTLKTFLETETLLDQILTDPDSSAHALGCVALRKRQPVSSSLNELLANHSMEYYAPYFEWVSKNELSMDIATCTQVLMHIERPLLDQCFKMVHSLLRSGGLFMSTIHLIDIYSNSDSSISIYNHLKYSRSTWSKIVNSQMMTFNRLKSRDYREALEEHGFEILAFEVDYGGSDDLELLQATNIHPEFKARYSEMELSEKHLFFVARKL